MYWQYLKPIDFSSATESDSTGGLSVVASVRSIAICFRKRMSLFLNLPWYRHGLCGQLLNDKF